MDRSSHERVGKQGRTIFWLLWTHTAPPGSLHPPTHLPFSGHGPLLSLSLGCWHGGRAGDSPNSRGGRKLLCATGNVSEDRMVEAKSTEHPSKTGHEFQCGRKMRLVSWFERKKETNKNCCLDLLLLQKEMEGKKEIDSFGGDLAYVAGHL